MAPIKKQSNYILKMASQYMTVCAVLFAMFCLVPACAGVSFDISLNSSDVRGNFSHFWKSTGFCPPMPHKTAGKFDLNPDMRQNLAYIGAVPFSGITQVRVHWLLELVKVTSLNPEGPVYNFSELDDFVALMHLNELHLGFELMGNPSNIFTDMENKTQVYWWRDLVSMTAHRYIALYGLDYVRLWKFETWNEPDCHDFDQLRMTVQGFLNYYDACSEGLKAVDAALILGGPGDGCKFFEGTKSSSYADALLNHTIRGINFFTGETGVRIDFLSFHYKGAGKTANIIVEESKGMEYIKLNYPELINKPFYNDEADPMVGWEKPFLWRASAAYGGLVAKIVTQHQNIFRANMDSVIKNYVLLSNDNAFLSYYPNQFTQRTLLARFQMNNTEPHYVTFVRKPAYSVMTMLALLGDKQIHLNTSVKVVSNSVNISDFDALATVHEPVEGTNTSDSWQMTLLLFGVSDPGEPTDYAILYLNWIIDPAPDIKSLKMVTYGFYNGGSDPYDVWAGLFNKTSFPTLKEFAFIRLQEDPFVLTYDVPVKAGQIPIPPMFQILDPHVLVMHLCAEPHLFPEKVTGVRFINVTVGQVMVIWSDTNIKTKCLLTYDVELSQSSRTGPYTKVNKQNSIITLFLYETDMESKVRGYYRVRAVDYWKKGGEYSEPSAYL